MKIKIKSISYLFTYLKSYILGILKKTKSMLHINDGHSRAIAWLKLIIIGAIFILISSFIVIFSTDFSDIVKAKFPKISTDKPIFSKVKNLTLSYMDSKNNLTSVFLKEAEELSNKNKILVNNIDTKIVFNTNEWLNIKSENAIIDKNTSEIHLKDNVLVKDYKGDILNGKNIIINIKNNIAFSNDKVEINSFFGKISSTNGFNIQKDNKYLFKGYVKAKFDPNFFSKGYEIPFQNIDISDNIKYNTKFIKKREKNIIKSINSSKFKDLNR